jgi:hypothetical protein
MSRSLVTAEKITPPKELEVLFDDPPLVRNERREKRAIIDGTVEIYKCARSDHAPIRSDVP